jgi:AcrR family transcriptional regulator
MGTGVISKSDRTRKRLLDSAVTLFGAGGLRATPVAAIAREAGVSAPTAFSYFTTKEELFEAAIDHDARQVIVDLLHTINDRDDPADQAEATPPAPWLSLVDDLLRVVEQHPLAGRILAGHEPNYLDALLHVGAFDDLRGLLAAAIRVEQATGITRSDLDPERAAIGMETITLSLVIGQLRLNAPVSDERRAGVAEVLMAAFRPPPS